MRKRPNDINVVTNPNKIDDGFGENLKMLLLSVMYAEINECKFVYTPFKEMEHNYNKDPEYLQKKEYLINFIKNFDNVSEQEPHHVLNTFELLRFFHLNVEQCSKSKSLQKIKVLFRIGKPNPFDSSFMNVAIHIRRMNVQDYNRIGNSNGVMPGMDVPNELYLGLIQQLRSSYSNVKIHIYSQGNIGDFHMFMNDYTTLHINETLEDTFIQMVFADILVSAPSALSYTAALLSTNVIYYIQFCNLPLPTWNIVQGYKSTRIKHEFVVPMLTPVYYDPYTDQFQLTTST